MTFNLEAAELFTRVDFHGSTDPRDWTHDEGRSLNDGEVALLGTMTAADRHAAFALTAAQMAIAEIGAELADLLLDVLGPYWSVHPECQHVGELVDHLPADDRERVRDLVTMVEATL